MRHRVSAGDPMPTPEQEFARQLRWRLVLVAACFAIDLLFLFTGSGTTSGAVLLLYVPYLVGVSLLFAGLRRRGSARWPLVPIMVAVFAGDLLFVAAQLHFSGGGWWHGSAFFLLAITIAAGTVPARALAVVTALGVVVYLGKGWLEISGILPPPVWGNFPRVDGNTTFFWNYAAFGTLLMVGTAVVHARLVSRLRRMQLRHRAILDASPYLVLTIDAAGDIIDASRVAEVVTGREADELPGTPLASLFDHAERERLASALERARTGERFRAEFRGTAASDRQRWHGVGFSWLPSDNAHGAVVVIMRDMTVERIRDERNAQLARELEEARRLELVGRLVSGVAHELNNPLTAILALTEQLEQEPSRDQANADARLIHEQARRARSIVRDLLQVVRAPAPATLVCRDARQLTERALAGLATREELRRVTLSEAVAETVCAVEVEEGSVEQVLANLVVNALQATAEGGRIDVSVTRDRLWVEFEVCDTGHGFDEATAARLFEPFFTTRAPGQGTGLGLAVSRAIAERHGGTLTASSTSGRTCFTLRLPRSTQPVVALQETVAPSASPQAPSAMMSSAPTPEAGTHPESVVVPAVATPARRVLLVDDEEAIRLAVGRWFTRRGWQVDESPDGASAIARLVTDGMEYDLVICDLKMPGVSGMDVHAAIASHRPAQLDRFVIATGDVASREVAHFLASARLPVLEKPFALAQLAALVDDTAGAAG